MLGWKYLSFVGLLLFCGQFQQVLSDDVALPTCTLSDPVTDDTTGAVTTEAAAQSCKGDNETDLGESYCKFGSDIYKSTDNSCTIDDTSATGYVLFNCDQGKCSKFTDFTTNPTALLVYYCTYSNKKCAWAQNPKKYYYDSSKSKLFSCEGTSPCATVETAGYYLINSSNSNSSSVVLVKVDDQNAVTSETIKVGYYPDTENYTADGKTYSKLIKCTSTTSCSSVAVEKAGIYINAAGSVATNDALFDCTDKTACKVKAGAEKEHYINAADNGLIKCAAGTGEDTTVTCTNDSSASGYYLDDSSKDENNAYSKLIKCTSGSCSQVTQSDGILINAADSGLIKCTSGSCVSETASADNYYLDESTNNKGSYSSLIKCSEGDNNSVTCESSSNVNDGIYIDQNSKDENNAYSKLIKCASGSCKSETPSVDNPYLDESTNTDGVYTNLIQCTADTTDTTKVTCESKEAVAAGIFIDESSKNGEDYSKLIECTEEESTKSCKPKDVAVGIYLNAAVDSGVENALINCTSATTCKAMTGVNGYYINAADSGLIKCSSDNGCGNDTTADGIYLDESDKSGDDYSKLIECITGTEEGAEASCSQKTIAVGIYLNAAVTDSVDNALINCTTTTACKALTGVNGNYINAADSGLIKCDTTSKCESVASTDIKTEVYYLDANTAKTADDSTTYSQLIHCAAAGEGENPKCDPYTTLKVGFYLNAIPDSSDPFKNSLIECTGTSDVTCVVKDLDATSDKDSIFIDNATGKLIQCVETDGCKAFAGTGTKTVPAFYVNGGKAGSLAATTATPATPRDETSSADYSDLIIRCDDSTCELTAGGENNVYLNANLKDTTDGNETPVVTNESSGDSENQLIICSAGACAPSKSEVSDGSDFYINAGAVDKVKQALIKCAKDSDVKCEIYDATLAAGITENFYKNGNIANDPTHYIIKCASAGCEAIASPNASAAADDVEHYVHGAPTEGAITDAIIQCTLKTSESATGRKREEAATDLTAECDFVSDAANGNIYINTWDQKLIQCTETACVAFSGVLGSAEVPAYYVNAAATSTDLTGVLIKCTGETCEEADGIENAVYINSNFKDTNNPNGDSDNRLIICSSEKCEAKDVDDNSTVSYFVNGDKMIKKDTDPDTTSQGRRTDSSLQTYANALIQCPAKADTLKSCTTFNGVEDSIYLNGNQATDNNYLIICNTGEAGEVCEAIAGVASGDNNDYYVNAGASAAEKLTDTLIKCSTDSCAADGDIKGKIVDPVTELFFINSNYGEGKDILDYLIKCDAASGCVLYHKSENAEEGTMEHFVNGAQADTASGVIEVLFTSEVTSENENQGRKREGETILASCKLVGAENNIYLNTFNEKLILCTSDGCAANASIGTKDITAYYLNAAVPVSEEASAKEYKDDIIACDNTKCSIIDGAEDQIFLNSNQENDTDNYLIICNKNNENGEMCSLDAGKASEDEKEKYYVNAGKYVVQSVTYALIKCDTAGCSGEKVDLGSAQELFFINGNYGNENDAENYLIKCTSEKCEATYNASAKEGDVEHYVYGAPDATEKSKNAVIECTLGSSGSGNGERRKREDGEESSVLNAECQLIENTKGSNEANTYINTINPIQIILCIASGCEAINNDSTSKDSSYYINEDAEGKFTLIKCTPSGCEIVTSFAEGDSTEEGNEEGDINKVFINANYKIGVDTKYPLIKCPGSGSTSSEGEASDEQQGARRKREGETSAEEISCVLSESKAEDEKPEFYVNGDRATNPDVIKCVKNEASATTLGFTCSTSSQTVKPDDIFLNGNYEVSSKQIIKCTADEGCKEMPAYPEDESGEEDAGNAKREEGSSSSSSSDLIYYINAGSVKSNKLEDTLIQCTSSSEACDIKVAHAQDIYINANTAQLILCYESGCVAKQTNASKDNNEFYLNSSDLENESNEVLNNDIIKCTLDTTSGQKKCVAADGKDGKVYINSYNTSQLIYCLEDDGCALKNSTAIANHPEYFVNGDDIDFVVAAEERKRDGEAAEESTITTSTESNETDSDPLNGDLIECKQSGSNVKCSVINGNLGDVYINGNYNAEAGDKTNQLIKCYETGCVVVEVKAGEGAASLEDLPEYYINSGNRATSKLKEAIIKCSKEGEACEVIEANPNEIYVNSNEITPEKPIIKCTKNNCVANASAATELNKEYYINAGKVNDEPLKYDIIECSVGEAESAADTTTSERKRASSSEGTSVICKCLDSEDISIDTGNAVYLNSNYAESGDNYQLIQCSKDNGCEGVRSNSTSKQVEYYVNAESDSLNNAIIFCSNKKCEKQTPESVPKYYLGTDGSNEVNGLIECAETTVTSSSAEEEPQDETDDQAEEPVDEQPQDETSEARRKRRSGETVNKCTMKTGITSQGYYLNSGSNKSVNQTITCDSSEGCTTLKVDLGYYVNAGNAEKPIIKCEKEGSECVEEDAKACPEAEKAVAGDYCYEDSQLKFFTASNSTAVSATKSDDVYAFATIPSNGFPGIKSETGSLFKISRYFINRYYQSGVVMIDKAGKLVDTLSDDQSDISIYDCNDSNKMCNERPGCTPNTYMFDSENKKAIFCNDGKMEYAQFNGYVVDGNRVTGGSKHPYIIYCENNGEKCISFKQKDTTYYENSGYDSSTNSLIQCNRNNCMTVAANVGYYVAHGEKGHKGVIKCSSSTSCVYSPVKSNVKFVNAGLDKTSNALIECEKSKGCNSSKAKHGYYLTYTSTLLIQCTSPNTCSEFTPTVNYYDNADSTESKSTIINCVQNSSVVTCSAEATNNGFYMSSVPNILIRCKAGSKCKTVTVKNGIFRGALKGLTSGNRRSYDEEKVNDRKDRGRVDDQLEEDGKAVHVRDSDDAYGIIRCVAGKCSALSPSELAAIPMCEFNNNKCYITLEYAMTKSATTSIAAGNICTNSDRSVFYFATDTVVVKPNVISGVTATYTYTTTNSNCLEVNDSYDDMYFTVGSNIYTLDQGSVLQFYETGYYFINVDKNTLVGGNKIDAYNDENVMLYRCNGSSCSIVNKPESITYFADVNKRILKYNVNSDSFTFAYDKDITCIFANNKCTPNADLKNQEFCITYKGEIVLAKTDIKNRETGECYRASSIGSYIYGYSQHVTPHLYSMNQFAAQMIDQTGYYIVSLSTNTTVVSKNYKTKNSNIVVYGCNVTSCTISEPDEDTYYYDAQARTILRYRDGGWKTPSSSGYAYISLDPTNAHIYRFTKNGEEVKITAKASNGYYYTVDEEMYHCDQDEDGGCEPIEDTGYYFTNTGEVYYCVHDSEELEPTECQKQACVSGQYYYIDEVYYRCEGSSVLAPVVSRYCSYDDNVVVNFPLALTEELPDQIKQAVEGIEKNNNSTAVISRRGKNILESVSGIFTNCTYNVEETKSTFDLVCVNNFVTVDEESDDVKICSTEQLGFVECIEDEDNPEKCNVSGAVTYMKPSLMAMVVVLLVSLLFRTW